MADSEFLKYFATNIFTDSNRAVCEVKDAFLQIAGAAVNQTLVTAVTAKKIVVLSLALHSTGAAGHIVFKSGNAGTNLRSYLAPINTSASPMIQEPLNFSGIFRTASGIGLFIDNNSAAICNVAVSYIEVTA